MPPSPRSQPDADDAATLDALRLLASRPDLSQRQLSRELGLSLGKTHYVLHALLDKGLVKIKNFKRSDNKLAYAYLLTPKGLRERLDLTRDFLVRKEAEFESLRRLIAGLRDELDGEPATHASQHTGRSVPTEPEQPT
jgi:EPS-associated MarR family transcriptional regulator